MKKYLNKRNIIVFTLTLIILLIIIFIFLNPFIYFKNYDSKNITIEVNKQYKIPPLKAYLFSKNITKLVKKSGVVNTSKIGIYNIKYKVKYLLTTKSIIIKINVVDNTQPKIELIGDNPVNVCPNKKYVETGFKATDNYDGDITKNIIRTEYKYYINYSVKDSSNNKFNIKRLITYVDSDSPSINLKGSSNITIILNSVYKEYGYEAKDNCDGDITKDVEVTNNINLSKLGTYYINYKVKDSNGNETTAKRTIKVVNRTYSNNYSDIVSGPTYINGILIVNKKYSLPSNYGNGVDSEAYSALKSLQNAASILGYNIPFLSGYRSYVLQSSVYNNYVSRDGVNIADTYSARPGHSEHQTGLAFDIGSISNNYGETREGIWLKNNAHFYGFIIRYPKGKEYITGYQYEPWHVRYVGVNHATKIFNNSLTLEEYLGV